jgi:rhodanese-related sulfurtransferase
MRHFRPIELKNYLDNEKQPLLLDVREPWEFEICQIEGSRLIPMRQIPQQAAALDPNQEIVLICHHGIRSRQVGYFLENTGFTNLINLTGGVEAWAREVEPNMPTY